MKKEIFISLEKEVFRGNVLDIGLQNHGIVYNIFKQYNDDSNVEYLCGKEEKEQICVNFYDSCILFFSLSSLWSKKRRKEIISDINKYLNNDGILYLWDIDKAYGKIFNCRLKVGIPQSKIRQLELKEFNILKDVSKENVLKLIENYFDILDFKSSDGIYYIRAKKKVESKDKDKITEEGSEKKYESTVNSA